MNKINMAQYVDKSALLAELEDWRDKIKKGIFSIPLAGRDRADAAFEYEILGKVRDFLDTLEVKDMDEIIKTAEDHAYFAGSENTREKLIGKACEWLRKGGSGWYLTSEFGENEIDFVKLAEDLRKAVEDET